MEHKHLNTNDIVSLIIIFLIAIGITCNIALTQKNLNLVGKQLVIDTDTLTVRQYDEHKNIFILSNDKIADRKIIKNNLID